MAITIVLTGCFALTLWARSIPTASAGYIGPETNGSRYVICQVFGRYCRQAIAVARCESRFSVRSTNGQYLGLFQMGSWERRTYGHGQDAWSQARAAHRYFVASGRDWSPWTCKPWHA